MTKRTLLNLNMIIFAFVFFSYNGKAQEMKNTKNNCQAELESATWITDQILGLDPNVEQYHLTKYTERKFAGNLTNFEDKMVFNSSYVAFCGNDDFTTVIGEYEFIDKDKLTISVDSVTYSGEWTKPTEYRKPKKVVFLISKIEETIILTKQSN